MNTFLMENRNSAKEIFWKKMCIEYIERNSIDMKTYKLDVFSTKKRSILKDGYVFVNHAFLISKDDYINLKKRIINEKRIKSYFINNFNEKSIRKIKPLLELL